VQKLSRISEILRLSYWGIFSESPYIVQVGPQRTESVLLIVTGPAMD